MARSLLATAGAALFLVACAVGTPDAVRLGVEAPTGPPDAGAVPTEAEATVPVQQEESREPGLSDGEVCAGATARAQLGRQPVDIIWVVDNSVSMRPAIEQVTQGINRLATRIGESDLDYRVVMLSLRGRGRVRRGDDQRFGVCVPPPLAGDVACGNGERFWHSSVDVLSTQPLEQLLGTLGQTEGYREGQSRGGESWRHFLRAAASKTVVVVTDDNSRLSANHFEYYRGGTNPRSSRAVLPPGLLDESWGGLFEGYVFHGLYGWGSENEPGTACRYRDGSKPPSSGPTYSTLVARTEGVRARICDGSRAWGPFFEAIASAVQEEARISCRLDLPEPPEPEELDPTRVNVAIRLPGAPPISLRKVEAAVCGQDGGWYYDDDLSPSTVVLCPSSCELAQQGAGSEDAGVEVEFGCYTRLI